MRRAATSASTTRGPPGDARAAAPQRRRSTKSDFRQDAPDPVDGLMRQRLDRPYIRRGGKLEEVSWYEAFNEIAARVKKGRACGRLAPSPATCARSRTCSRSRRCSTNLARRHRDCRQLGAKLHPKHGRGSYLFNSTIAGVGPRRRGASDRRESPQGSGGPQHALAQGLPAQQRQIRIASAPHADLTYPLRMARQFARRPSTTSRATGSPVLRMSARRIAPACHRGPGGARSRRGRKRALQGCGNRRQGHAGQGRVRLASLSASCIQAPRSLAASTSASCRAKAASISPACWKARPAATSKCFISSARTSST